MIVRIMVVDPKPRNPLEDVIVYQVPEKSRAYELLLEMLDTQDIDYVEIASPRKKRKKRAKND